MSQRKNIYLLNNDSSCVLYLPLQKGWGTTAKDFSEERNDGTLYNFPSNDLTLAGTYRWVHLIEKGLNGGINFDGSTSYAYHASYRPLHNLGALSIEARIIPEDMSATWTRIVSQHAGSTNVVVELMQNEDDIYFKIGDGSSNVQHGVTSCLTAGVPVHIVCVWDKSDDSGKLTIYIDNVADTSSSGITSNSSANDEIWVGAADWGAEYFDGTIARVAIYDGKLTAAEVEDLYLGEITRVQEHLLAIWEFQEGNGSTLYDGTAWGDGKYGRAIYFDGSNDHINISSHSATAITDDFTLELWGYVDDLGDTWARLLTKETSAGTIDYGLILDDSDPRQVKGIWYNAGGTESSTGLHALTEDTWYHIVVTRDRDGGSNNFKLYVNATVEQQATDGGAAIRTTGSTNIYLGGRGSNNNFNGYIQGAAIYDECKDSTWVSQRYNGLNVGSKPIFTDGPDGVPRLSLTLPNNDAGYDDLIKPNDQLFAWMNDTQNMGGRYIYAFAGRAWNVNYAGSNRTIEVEVKGWAADLSRQYNATYGKVTGTTNCKDVADLAADLMPGGFTSNKAAETGMAGAITISKGTTVLSALRQLLGTYPYIYGIDKYKDLYTLLRWDTAFTHDQHTESTTGWAVSAGAVGTTGGIFGSNSVYAATAGADLRSPLVAVSNSDYDAVVFYVTRNANPDKLILYTARTGYNNGTGWERTLEYYGSGADWNAHILLLPESASLLHGWTEKGSPTYTDNIIYLELIDNTGSSGAGPIDGWNFIKFKPAAEAVNTLDITKVTRAGTGYSLDGYVSTAYVYTSASGSPDTINPAASYGDTEDVMVDLSLTHDGEAYNWGSLSVLQKYAIPENEIITVGFPFKTEYLNLQRGDTVEVTEARANLSSFQATVVGIQHTPQETTVQLNAQPGMTLPRAETPRRVDRPFMWPEPVEPPDRPLRPEEIFFRRRFPTLEPVTEWPWWEADTGPDKALREFQKGWWEATKDAEDIRDRRKYWS